MSTTTTEPTTTTITIRPSSLAEAWIVFLESGGFEQTHEPNFTADSDRRGCVWQALAAMEARAGIRGGGLREQVALAQWADGACRRLGHPSAVEANDRGKTFAQIAAAMREELASAPI